MGSSHQTVWPSARNLVSGYRVRRSFSTAPAEGSNSVTWCSGAGKSTLSVRRELLGEMDERADHRAGRTLGEARRSIRRRGSGDVEMDPGRLVDELAQEEAGGDGSGGPAAAVLQVRDVALDLLLVLVVM